MCSWKNDKMSFSEIVFIVLTVGITIVLIKFVIEIHQSLEEGN